MGCSLCMKFKWHSTLGSMPIEMTKVSKPFSSKVLNSEGSHHRNWFAPRMVPAPSCGKPPAYIHLPQWEEKVCRILLYWIHSAVLEAQPTNKYLQPRTRKLGLAQTCGSSPNVPTTSMSVLCAKQLESVSHLCCDPPRFQQLFWLGCSNTNQTHTNTHNIYI